MNDFNIKKCETAIFNHINYILIKLMVEYRLKGCPSIIHLKHSNKLMNQNIGCFNLITRERSLTDFSISKFTSKL